MYEGSNVAITAEDDSQYHFYKVTVKQITSALIKDDYGTQFPKHSSDLGIGD